MAGRSIGRGTLALFLGVLVLPAASPARAGGIIENEIEQCFPAPLACPEAESGWRIKWRIFPAGYSSSPNFYGHSAVWEITSVEFMRGRHDGAPDWVKILNRLALADIFVPYNNGRRVYDIGGFHTHEFPLVRLDDAQEGTAFFSTQGFVPPRIFDGVIAAEVLDDGIRWIKNGSSFPSGGKPDQARRGQALTLWAVLWAANYRYILSYSFVDDGSIRVRLGATGQNLYSPSQDHSGHGTHVHMGAWRMEFSLGDEASNRISVVEAVQSSLTGAAEVIETSFNQGREGGIVLDPTRFTMLKVTSGAITSRHDPPKPTAYALVPGMPGKLRSSGRGEGATAYDIWVTRLAPDGPPERTVAGQELSYRHLPVYVQQEPLPLEGEPVAIWHGAALLHIPRGEDFGPKGYDRKDGVALTGWAGFTLVPRDLWDGTPFFKRD